MEPVIISRARPTEMIRDYVSLTKPRIIVLLLITAYCAMVVAKGTLPSGIYTLNTLGGLTLSIAGAHAINMWYDRDIDQLMVRTRERPVAQGRIAPMEALSFGIFLETSSWLWLSRTVNDVAALCSLFGFLIYVVVYTVWLKRRSPQNIVIGGAAGAFPPLVGWAAITPHWSITPVLMFMTIFLWTPPHFWALALYKQEDYRRAHVPMLPLIVGPRSTIRAMFLYSLLLIVCSLALGWFGNLGALYFWTALALGLGFGSSILLLMGNRRSLAPKKVFFISLLYMAGIFSVMVAAVLSK